MGAHVPKAKETRSRKSPVASKSSPAPAFDVSAPSNPSSSSSSSSSSAAAAAVASVAAALPQQPFQFERPKLPKQPLFVEEQPLVASNAVTLCLPQKAWASLGASLSTRDLSRASQVCRSWKASIATSVRIVTLWAADGCKIKQLRAILPNVERLVFADAMTLMQCGEEDLPSLVHLQELQVLAPPQVFPSKLGSAHDASMVEFCLIAPHLPHSLTSLSLPLSRIAQGSLSVLEKMTNLTHLDLSRCDWRADAWNWTPLSDSPMDDWIDFFPPSIVSLHLAHCHVRIFFFFFGFF